MGSLAVRSPDVVACRGGAVIGITLEPPRYGMTGPECGIGQHMRRGFDADDAQALDAPEYIARGSVRVSRQVIDGTAYASTTDAMPARMFGGCL